jgi:hypothetical protein
MNYFLLFVILGVCGGAYYMYTTDQQKTAALTAEVIDLQGKLKAAGVNPNSADSTPPTVAPSNGSATSIQNETIPTIGPSTTPAPPPTVAPSVPAAPPAVATVHQTDSDTHASAIDAAANAATAAANGTNIGTITTLDHHTYTNCRVLKVEQDGVTFSHDDGITKILFPMLPPDVQKQFGYTPQAAVAQTEAQIRAMQDQQNNQQATNAVPASP